MIDHRRSPRDEVPARESSKLRTRCLRNRFSGCDWLVNESVDGFAEAVEGLGPDVAVVRETFAFPGAAATLPALQSRVSGFMLSKRGTGSATPKASPASI